MSTTRTAAQAAARSLLYSYYQTGYCLNFVWNCISAPKSYNCYDANEAWSRAAHKVTTGTPPAGAPVYFRGGSHGHIAISIGGGRIRSTDWPSKGRVGTVNINDLCRDWYGTTDNYRGWSRDLCGDPIPGLQVTTSTPTTYTGFYGPISMDYSVGIDESALHYGLANKHVPRLRSAIWNWRGLSFRHTLVTKYGLKSRDPIHTWQTYNAMTQWMVADSYALLKTIEPGAWTVSNDPGPAFLRRIGLKPY